MTALLGSDCSFRVVKNFRYMASQGVWINEVPLYTTDSFIKKIYFISTTKYYYWTMGH